MNGIILIDKPADWTSHDVVGKVRGILKHETGQKVKVGHTGTLDPFATGLLILVTGSFTKKAAEFSGMDKTYEAEMILGATSTTGDPEGEISDLSSQSSEKPSQEALEAIFSQFKGDIMQMPHKYSAKKVGGQKAYDLARAGKEVKLEPKQITIHDLRITSYEYPSVKFTAKVSSGTYIRSLAEDIGAKLGTGAYLLALRRTSVGDYIVENAKAIDNITISDIIQG
jgi:tRNA pseudouridine55 synthase